MPPLRRLFMRRMGPVGVALTAWDIWRRIPANEAASFKRGMRSRMAAEKHGPPPLGKAAVCDGVEARGHPGWSLGARG